MRREERYDINMFTEEALDPKPASGGSSFLVGNGKAAYAKGHPLHSLAHLSGVKSGLRPSRVIISRHSEPYFQPAGKAHSERRT
jgi:hypothetical protein